MKEILNAGKEVIKEYVDKNMLPGACFAYVEKEGFVCDCYGYKSLVPQKEETSRMSVIIVNRCQQHKYMYDT